MIEILKMKIFNAAEDVVIQVLSMALKMQMPWWIMQEQFYQLPGYNSNQSVLKPRSHRFQVEEDGADDSLTLHRMFKRFQFSGSAIMFEA